MRTEGWLRKPNHYRLDGPQQTVIDDGRKRLTVDRQAEPSVDRVTARVRIARYRIDLIHGRHIRHGGIRSRRR